MKDKMFRKIFCGINYQSTLRLILNSADLEDNFNPKTHWVKSEIPLSILLTMKNTKIRLTLMTERGLIVTTLEISNFWTFLSSL